MENKIIEIIIQTHKTPKEQANEIINLFNKEKIIKSYCWVEDTSESIKRCFNQCAACKPLNI
jgi:hypothetical protein